MKKYELLLILDPAKSEEQNNEVLDQLDEVIKKYGGVPDRRQVMGKRRLAFPINKRRDGYYVTVFFDTETSGPIFDEVQRFCKYSDDVLRHLMIVAVVGKSKGDPSKAPEERRFSGPPRGPRSYDRGADRGGPRPVPTEGAPAPADPAAAAAAPAAAPAAPEAAPAAAPQTEAAPAPADS